MPTSSQGFSFSGLPSELITVKISNQSVEQDGQPKLNSSHLGTSTYHTYVDGLTDSRGGAGGYTSTITCEFYGSAPTVGEEISYGGKDYICTSASDDYSVGELKKGSATYTSKQDTPAAP